MNITPEERKKVKGQGFLSNKDGEHFSARIITENGVLTAGQMRNLSEAAERFGNGQIAFTSRMTLELPGVPFDQIEDLKQHIAQENMVTGGTGSRVRPVVACKGTVCTFGLIDTQALAQELHHRFYQGYYNVTLPHKFKIAVGGCPNNCVKPDLNDVGIVGQRVPSFQSELCKGCGKCAVTTACPMDAAKVENGLLNIDASSCNNCGRCVGTCPFGAIPDGQVAYKIYVGGRWGKKIRHGTPLVQLFTREEALDVVEKAILLFKSKGITGERFADLVERLGPAKVEKMLVSDRLLKRKEEILETQTIGGASC